MKQLHIFKRLTTLALCAGLVTTGALAANSVTRRHRLFSEEGHEKFLRWLILDDTQAFLPFAAKTVVVTQYIPELI